MKLTLEVYSTSAGDAGGAPSFGVRIRDRRALEAGALYDPLDVNFLVDNEFLPAPETVAVSIYRPSEDGEDALVATTAESVFAPVPGHSMMRRGALATSTPGFDSWYEETRCPDGDHAYPVPVFSILEVRWSCGAEDCMARAGAVPAILTPIGVRAVKGLDGEDGEDGKAPEVDVAARGDGTYTMTVTSPDGTSQTVEWRDGRDGDGTDFPAPVSPADATEDDQYADALAVQGLLDSLRKDLSGVTARLDVLDSLAGVEYLESIRESLLAKVDKRDGYDLVSTDYIRVLDDFVGTFGEFGNLAGLNKITFTELGTDLAERFKALESAVESLPPPGDGGTLNAGYVKFLDTVVASGDGSAQRILDAVDLVLAESNDAGKGIWKAVNANAKGLAELEAKVGSGGSSSIPAELEAMIRNSVQKDAFGRGFSSNDFTQDYIDRINNSVQKEPGKGLSTVDFTMERAERLDALFNSSSTLNPPVKPDGNAKEGQPADAKDTYEALKGLSFTEAPDSHGSEWQAELEGTPGGAWTFTTQPSLEWRTSTVTGDSAWYVTPFTVKLSSSGVPVPGSALEGAYLLPGTYPSEQNLSAGSFDRNLDDVVCACHITGVGTTAGESVRISIQVRFHRELYVYKGDSYVTKTYVDDKLAGIEFPEGGGTTDYGALSNKPSINGMELSGSMTVADLGLSTVEGDDEGYGSEVAKQAANSYRAEDADHAAFADRAESAANAGLADIARALEDASGDSVSSASVLERLTDKRDRTDNIAAVASYSSEWNVSYEIHSASEELKAKLELWFSNTPTSISGSDSEGWNWNNLPVIEGYYTEDAPEIEGAYAHTTYISDTDLHGFSIIGQRPTVGTPGEPFVTPTGVKALTAPGFSQLAPETSEGKVTLKPVDGAANHGTGKIVLGPSGLPLRELRIDVMLSAEYDNPDPDGSPFITYHGSTILRDFSVDTWDVSTDEFVRQTRIGITVTDDVNFSGDDGNIARIPKGTQMAFLALEAFQEDESFADLGMYIEHGVDGIQAIVPGVLETSTEAYFSQHIPKPKSVTVHVPASTDTTKAREFTIAVETDVEAEKAVEWHGGEVVEAFPGASKLAVGTTVWDVKEVAPGKMLVNRAPGSAQSVQSGPLTLTAPNGRVAELAVDDDLVLEVKEV